MEPGPFLIASLFFAAIIGLTACDDSGAFTPEPAHTVCVPPQPTHLARHAPDPTRGRLSTRFVPYLILTEVQPTDV